MLPWPWTHETFQRTLWLMMIYHQTKLGFRKSLLQKMQSKESRSDNISPHCDLNLENSSTFSSQHFDSWQCNTIPSLVAKGCADQILEKAPCPYPTPQPAYTHSHSRSHGLLPVPTLLELSRFFCCCCSVFFSSSASCFSLILRAFLDVTSWNPSLFSNRKAGSSMVTSGWSSITTTPDTKLNQSPSHPTNNSINDHSTWRSIPSKTITSDTKLYRSPSPLTQHFTKDHHTWHKILSVTTPGTTSMLII